jgi:outer membrane protein TolC
MRTFISIFLLFLFTGLFAQNDTTLTLQQSESLFLKNNLTIMAGQFNVEAAKAAIIQTRLWENPILTSELNAYNPERKKYFDVGSVGQKAFGIEQLIYLGGKKRNEVALARTNADIAEQEFADLLRNLKFQLRQSYFALYYDNQSYIAISNQISNLDSLIKSYATQVQKGNLPMKDLVRLQSLYFGFKQQKSDLYNGIIENQRNLQLITGIQNNIIPKPNNSETNIYQANSIVTIDSLKNKALANRTDLLIAQKQVEAANFNVKWQKSLAIPDVTVGVTYDQLGSAFKNEVSLSLGIPLPLWNRNQGNIKIAKAQQSQTGIQQTLSKNTVLSEVASSYQKWQEANANFKILNPESQKNFDDVEAGVLRNFKDGNISLIEFTDFMESYTLSMMQFHQFAKNLINACEEINYTTNSKIF